MEAAEQVIRAGLLRLGGSMLGEILSADRGHRGRRVPCGRGHEAVFVSYRDKVIDTVLGPVALTRAWYHCAACGHGLAPRDAELGVAGEGMSPGLAAMNDRAAAAVPFKGAAGLLENLAGVRLTAKRAERAAEASGAGLAAAGRERARLIAARKLVPLPPSPLPDKLDAVIDGTGVPTTSRETAGREGKGEDGRARTREVKLAVFFTQDRLDKDGYPVRDRDSSSVIATFEPAAVFGELVKAEGIRRGADHVRQLTVIGDGAAWIWNIATAKFPEATQIVDLFHAREHLHDLARRLEFMLLDRKEEWLAARLEDLDYGDIDGIVRATRQYPLEGVKKDEIDTALGYFGNNAPRMRYHWFRQCGLFVGSGVVEASCKTVVGQRLKQSGMHWTVSGADAIIALRCREASSTREAICNTPHTQTRTA
ncbi:MAG TPA: ISKra4 family transposase [Streptosporangiaceae bacterium]|nr:ISKra4 family transposase [Streptosporangiaceae bacterium]